MNIELLPEEAVDRHIERTVQFASVSEINIKFACIAAAPIVGSYSEGTQQIARRLKRSVSTIGNYAHAFWMYSTLRNNGHAKAARQLWRTLPASHWWQAWDIHTAGYDAFHYLSNANIHSWSGRDMMTEYRNDRDAGTAPLVFQRARHALVGLIDELLKQPKNLTDEQIEALNIVADLFEEKE